MPITQAQKEALKHKVIDALVGRRADVSPTILLHERVLLSQNERRLVQDWFEALGRRQFLAHLARNVWRVPPSTTHQTLAAALRVQTVSEQPRVPFAEIEQKAKRLDELVLLVGKAGLYDRLIST